MRAVIFQLMLATAVPVGLLGGLAEAQQSNNCKLPGGICQSSNFQALAGSCITFEPGGAELCPLPDGGFPFSGGGGGGCFPYLDGGGVCDEFGIPGGVGLSGSSVFGPSGGDVSLQNIGGPNWSSIVTTSDELIEHEALSFFPDGGGPNNQTLFAEVPVDQTCGLGVCGEFVLAFSPGGDGGLVYNLFNLGTGQSVSTVDESGHVTGADGLTPTAFVTHEQVACPFGSFSTLVPDGGAQLVCDTISLSCSYPDGGVVPGCNTSLPVNQIAYGTGAGITSSAVLKIVPAAGGEALQITETGSGANTGFWFQPAPVSTTTNYAFYAAPLGGVTGQNNVVNLYSDSTSTRGFELSTIGTAGAFTNYANAVVLDAMPNSGGTAQDICLVTQKSGETANYATTAVRVFANSTRTGFGGITSDDGVAAVQVIGTSTNDITHVSDSAGTLVYAVDSEGSQIIYGQNDSFWNRDPETFAYNLLVVPTPDAGNQLSRFTEIFASGDNVNNNYLFEGINTQSVTRVMTAGFQGALIQSGSRGSSATMPLYLASHRGTGLGSPQSLAPADVSITLFPDTDRVLIGPLLPDAGGDDGTSSLNVNGNVDVFGAGATTETIKSTGGSNTNLIESIGANLEVGEFVCAPVGSGDNFDGRCGFYNGGSATNGAVLEYDNTGHATDLRIENGSAATNIVARWLPSGMLALGRFDAGGAASVVDDGSSLIATDAIEATGGPDGVGAFCGGTAGAVEFCADPTCKLSRLIVENGITDVFDVDGPRYPDGGGQSVYVETSSVSSGPMLTVKTPSYFTNFPDAGSGVAEDLAWGSSAGTNGALNTDGTITITDGVTAHNGAAIDQLTVSNISGLSVPATDVAFGAPDGGVVGAAKFTRAALPDGGGVRVAVNVTDDGIHTGLQASDVYSPGTGFFAGGVNALSDATAQVSTQSATAPTVGQVLTATAATTADWETPVPQLTCPYGQFAAGPGDGGVPMCASANVGMSISGYFSGDGAVSATFARMRTPLAGSPYQISCATVAAGTTAVGVNDGGTGVIYVDLEVNSSTVICEVAMPCTTTNTGDAWVLCPFGDPDGGPGFARHDKLDLTIKKTGGSCATSPALNCQGDLFGIGVAF